MKFERLHVFYLKSVFEVEEGSQVHENPKPPLDILHT